MEWNPSMVAGRVFLLFVCAAIAAPHCGCIVVPLMYRGRMAPAACGELEGKRVAVVCTSNTSDFGPSPDAELIARQVGSLLVSNGKKIEVVSQQRVAAWMDEHDIDYIDYAEIGRGVEADAVIAVEVESLRLQENQTMYQGHAVYRLEVFDVENKGQSIYQTYTPPVVFPREGGFATTSYSKEQFRQKFTKVVAEDIARHFYEHDLNQLVAVDTPDLR